MKTNIRKNIEVTITLNEEETIYLRNLTQNFHGEFDDEPDDQRELRYSIFQALSSVLVP